MTGGGSIQLYVKNNQVCNLNSLRVGSCDGQMGRQESETIRASFDERNPKKLHF